MTAVAAPSQPVLTDDILVRCYERAPRYDRENTFFTEDLQELRDAGFLLLPVPHRARRGGAGRSTRTSRADLQRHLGDRVRRQPRATRVLEHGFGVGGVVLAVDLSLGVGHVALDPD